MSLVAPYREILRRPGAARFVAAAFVARLPMSMVGVGMVLLISARTGSYGVAGLVGAALTVSYAIGSPQVSRLVDRHGQRRVVAPALAVHTVAFVTLLTAAWERWPTLLLVVLAAVAGCSQPSTGALVRARWSFLLGPAGSGSTGGGLRTAYSLESVLDELIFVVGPPMVTLLATQVHPLAGLGVALTAMLVGTVLLLVQRATEPPVSPEEHTASRSALRARGMPAVMVAMVGLGLVFSGFEVTVVPVADAVDARPLIGAVLSTYAFGSMVAGLVWGTLHPRAPLQSQLAVLTSLMLVSLLPLPFVTTVPPLFPLALLAGVTIAPSLIAASTLVQRLVPANQQTEGFSWAVTGIAVGLALGAATVGQVADRTSPHLGFLVAVAGAALAAGSAALARRGVTAPDAGCVDDGRPPTDAHADAPGARLPAEPAERR